MSKIFGIGMPKTGTTSLAMALQTLGYNAIHSGIGILKKDMTLNMEAVEQFDAITDTPLVPNYKTLYKKYPDAKFVLTTRNTLDWLDSCKHWFSFEKMSHVPDYHALHVKIFGHHIYDEGLYMEAYLQHCLDVAMFFADKPKQLLVLDIDSNTKIQDLCMFLDKPSTDIDYPVENKNWAVANEGVARAKALNYAMQVYTKGSLNFGDIDVIIRFCSCRDYVVELGTNHGTTSTLLAMMNAHVMTVDIFEEVQLIENMDERRFYETCYRSGPHPYEVVKANLSTFGNVDIRKGLSHKLADVVSGISVDAILVDADHSYEGAKKDFEAWYPKIKKDGVFLFHDVTPHFGVYKYYKDELLKDDRISEVANGAKIPSSIKVFRKV